MTDEERPRPQFGEYATPEEQRARISQPDATDDLSAGIAPEPAGDRAGQHPSPSAEKPSFTERVSAVRSGPAVDRVVTWVLLTLGALNVLATVPGFFVFDRQLEATLELFGVEGPLADPAGVRLWGLIAAAVMVVGFAGTLSFAVWWMRRGRVAFWIPIVGAAVTTLIVAACVNVPIIDDPAFAALTDRLLGFSLPQ
jgi:hypothetical protein